MKFGMLVNTQDPPDGKNIPRLYQEVLAAGKPVEYYEYPGDDHNLANYFNLAMQRTIEFFDKYLKGGG